MSEIPAPGAPRMVLKLGLQGDAYVDGKQVSVDDMEQRVRELVERKGVLIYYREAPTTTGSEASQKLFERIVALRPAVMLGSNAPSEWGRLNWLEVEEAPGRSRVFVARGEKFLVAVPSQPGEKPTVYSGGPLLSAAEDNVLGSLDLMVRADRVMESRVHEADRAFNPHFQRAPSLHIRVAYASGRAWASYYPEAEVPGNLTSFVSDVHKVAGQIVAAIHRVRGGEGQ